RASVDSSLRTTSNIAMVPKHRPFAWRALPLQDADRSMAAGATVEQLADTVREAGDIALRTFLQPLRQWTKGASSPVSEADLAVDDFLRQRLGSMTPGAAWLSEETEDDPARVQTRNVGRVDP